MCARVPHGAFLARLNAGKGTATAPARGRAEVPYDRAENNRARQKVRNTLHYLAHTSILHRATSGEARFSIARQVSNDTNLRENWSAQRVLLLRELP